MGSGWDEKYEFNIKEIDAQHKKFFGILESTDPMMEKTELTDQDVYLIMRLLMELRNYGLFHFHTEEKLMLKVGYPGCLQHLDLHDEFLFAMNKFQTTFLGLFKKFQEGHANHGDIFDLFKDFVGYATKWYQNHISNEDAKYAYFIKQK